MLNHQIEVPFQSLNLKPKCIEVKKGTLLQLQGDTSLKFYNVNKGLLRSYILDEKGKEHIYMFAPEGWIIGDIYAYSKNKATQLFIDAIEDTEVYAISANYFNNKELLTAQEYKTEFDKLLNRVGVLQERVLMQMSASALTRYQHFAKTYPQLLNRVPQKMIASYLGITPEALSKVKNDWVKTQ